MIRPAPRNGREETPHWVAARAGRLVLPHCAHCGHFEWPARPTCATCAAPLVWRECAGTGTLLTWSVVHRAASPAWSGETPYVVAMVELDEGARLMSNIVECDPAHLACGQRVRARFVETTDPALGLVVFAPDPVR